MRKFMFVLFAAVLFLVPTTESQAQISVSIGVEPGCPYGYYDYAPYNCSPYGYYGTEWFNGGVFIGAGPWFHGPSGFNGHVNNTFDPRHGYNKPLPARGPAQVHPDNFKSFKPNESRDGKGHTAPERK